MKKNKKLRDFKLIPTVLIGFLAGITGAYVMNLYSGNTTLNMTGQTGQNKTSEVVYNNVTDTSKAAKTVQDAVVSVINYQKASNTSMTDIYSHIFGGRNNKADTSDEDLSVASEGSGVIYKKENGSAYVVTNNHVIDGAESIEIMLADGTKVVGELVGSDTYSDLAVVKISDDKVTTIAAFADSDKLNVGEVAIAMGSPLGTEYANSVTQGIVSSLSRTVTLKNESGDTISTNAIQTDAAINPGNSGGALINIQGQVIGINSSKISSTSMAGETVEGMGFAIPSNDVVKIINHLEKYGHVTRPALGISMADLSELSTTAIAELKLPDHVTSGIVIASVQDNMPVSGKLEQYDVITEIDGKEVTSASDLQSILYGHDINDTITITFYRGSDKQTANIKLTKSTQDLENH